MKPLSHEDYRKYYARRCSLCNSERSVIEDNVRKECICQKKARRKYRLEQIDIYPPELKYKDWSDFTGVIKKDGQTTGHLKVDSALAARDKAFRYCYDKGFDKVLLQNRLANLTVHKHIGSGDNLVICGDEETGRSLLGAIVCKEVANSSLMVENIDYRWIKFYDILNAARWTFDQQGRHKAVDHAYLDMLAYLDFLFIDGIDLPHTKAHNYPTDHVAMDALFGTRNMMYLPTVLICSKRILFNLSNPNGQENISAMFGYEFLHMLRKGTTTIIELVKDG